MEYAAWGAMRCIEHQIHFEQLMDVLELFQQIFDVSLPIKLQRRRRVPTARLMMNWSRREKWKAAMSAACKELDGDVQFERFGRACSSG